jgi:hypothetical protein
MEIQNETKPRIYYSSAANMIININKGRRVMEDNGVTKMVDQKLAEFTPQADGYGRLVTTDPEIIAKLDARMAAGYTDVFEAAEYNRRTTPVEIRLKMMETEHQRVIADNNRLLAMLKEQGKVPEKQGALSK